MWFVVEVNLHVNIPVADLSEAFFTATLLALVRFEL